ncbi:MAG: iron ABC transporter permease [Marinicaulis sp.]|nr:iron ABC transporter permease [Marinicaulis sp.]
MTKAQKPGGDRLNIVIFAIAAVVAAPILAIAWSAVSMEGAGPALFGAARPNYISETVLLCLGVGFFASIIGAVSAIIVATTEFPGRGFFKVALFLPFAIPAYIMAYSYADFFSPFGPFANLFGVGALPPIRSLSGAILVLTLATYPYVYITVYASLAARSGAYLEAGATLGASPFASARKLLLALSRPAIAGGLALVLMETIADFGVSEFFGVQTLSVGIFRRWHGLGDLGGATRLAIILFTFAIALMLTEDSLRRGAFSESARAHRRNNRLRLSAPAASGAVLFLVLPIIFGFSIPTMILISKLEASQTASALRGLSASFTNTAFIAIAGALLAALAAAPLAYGARNSNSAIVRVLLRISTMGYAIPGAVIAIGVLALTAGLSGAARIGGVAVLLYAYFARFLTASYNATSGGMAQIHTRIDEAAMTLGADRRQILFWLHWPMTRPSIIAGIAIVAMDIAKELPATLILRPFNFETLATRVYRLASDERLADAAPAALLLIAFGLIPALLLSAASADEKRRDKNAATFNS